MKTDQQYNDSIKIGCFSGMALLIMTLFLMMSCTSQPLTHDFGVSVAYPPYSCTDLQPDYLEVKIDGKMYTLDIIEVPGGFVTEKSLSLEFGRYTVQSIVAYDKKGNRTHYVHNRTGAKNGLVVVSVPFPIEVSERLPWISGQVFCD